MWLYLMLRRLRVEVCNYNKTVGTRYQRITVDNLRRGADDTKHAIIADNISRLFGNSELP